MIPFCQCDSGPIHSAEWIPARVYEPTGYLIAPPGTPGQIVDMEVCSTCGRAILGTQSTHTEEGEPVTSA